MFANAFTWLGLVILVVIAASYVLTWYLGKKMSFGWWMFGALILGLVVGAAFQLIFGTNSTSADMAFAFEIANIVRSAYTNLLQLMVMPLVMVAIITGITKAGGNKENGEGGVKNLGKAMGVTIATLLITCAISVLLTVIVTSIFGLSSAGLAPHDKGKTSTTLTDTIASIFSSTNIFATLSANSVLPMMFLALIFAVIILGMRKESPESAAKLEAAIDVIYDFVMGLVDIVIGFAPYGVLAYILNFAANTAFAEYLTLGVFVICSYAALIVVFVMHLVVVTLCGVSPVRFIRNGSKALMIAFSTRSSMATLPVTIQSMENMGVEPSIATFAGTFGTCIGQNGCGGVYPAMLATMVYASKGVALLADPGTLIMLIIIVTLCSAGIAGVGGGATMAGLMVFGVLGFDPALIGMLFSVEALIDMGRTFINVSDGMVAGVVAARFSGNLGAEKSAEEKAAAAAQAE